MSEQQMKGRDKGRGGGGKTNEEKRVCKRESTFEEGGIYIS